MMVSVEEAKERLQQLLQHVADGEEVVISDGGRAIACLVPATRAPRRRVLGTAKGQFVVPDDFDDPLPPEIEDSFYK